MCIGTCDGITLHAIATGVTMTQKRKNVRDPDLLRPLLNESLPLHVDQTTLLKSIREFAMRRMWPRLWFLDTFLVAQTHLTHDNAVRVS